MYFNKEEKKKKKKQEGGVIGVTGKGGEEGMILI